MDRGFQVRHQSSSRGIRLLPNPIALATAMLLGIGSAPGLAQINASSNDPRPVNLGGQNVAPASYLALPQRLRSVIEELRVEATASDMPADGVSSIDITVRLLDAEGKPVQKPIEVSVSVGGGARILVPRRLTTEAGADAADVDKVVPGTQLRNESGVLRFKVVAPMQPGDFLLSISAEGRDVDLPLSALPDERELFAVGLVELQVRADRVDARQLVQARENDGLDQELRAWRREFGNGRGRVAGRVALYLKGLVRGDYLLTLSYDSEKLVNKKLFDDIDPNALYPVYGDSSARGIDGQSTSKLYVRVDKGRSNIGYGDFSTAPGTQSLAGYSRSLTGVRAHIEEGPVVANVWLARTMLRQVVDEFPGRGISGPYSLSNPNGVQGSEKVEIVVRDRNQPAVILKTTLLQRFSDYEFEPFTGRILFRSPIPSVDDQLNPVSIRVTYEVDQGGTQFTVAGGDVRLKLSPNLHVGASLAKDQNPIAPYQVGGVSVEAKLAQRTVIRAEVARSEGTPNTGSSASNGASSDKSGNAYKVEVRHDDPSLRVRAYAARSDEGFDAPASGLTGGRTELGAQGALRLTKEWALRAQVIRSEDSTNNRKAEGAQLGVSYAPDDKFEIEVGIRHARQNAASLLQTGAIGCNGQVTIQPGQSGNNVGFGINPSGGQQIDPTTGLPVVCSNSQLTESVSNTLDTTNNSLFVRSRYRLNDKFSIFGEVGRDTARTSANGIETESNQTTYAFGAEYLPYEKTRLYLRHDYARSFTGLFGLGTGEGIRVTTVGIDTEYRSDAFLFSEYRLRDSLSGRDVQHAIGLRNGFNLAEGLKLVTGAEFLRTASNTAPATGSSPGNLSKALSLGLEYTANPLWKASGRLEWRDDQQATNWLMTAGVAGKLDRDWTILARNYYTLYRPDAGGRRMQDRVQFGFAYRPVDHNTLDALGLYEFKTDKDSTTLASSTSRTANILSLRLNWHPSRPWWISGRAAYKQVKEDLLGTPSQYSARLVSGRVMYDITNKWSLGAHWSLLQGQGGARQYAYGLEAGYVVVDNFWVVLGYTWRGFRDTDLAIENYTNRGWYLGLRYKFSEDLFGSRDPAVNKTLAPAPPASK
jgi:hypothetical protein